MKRNDSSMVLAVLQARMSSTRFPGKVLKLILGKPMLELQIERLRFCNGIDKLVVATSNHPEDHAIVDLCERIEVDSFAGSLENVLDRFYQVARIYQPDHVLRLTGDCPLTDPRLIDELISFYRVRDCDYASNCRPPTLPDGLDAEIFSFSTLEHAWKESVTSFEFEHVVPFIINHPDRFRMATYRYHEDLSHLRWVVDELDDLEFVTLIFEALYPHNSLFLTEDILYLLKEKPELLEINRHLKRQGNSV